MLVTASRRKSLARMIGVTGSPGTGKRSVGRALAKMLGYSFLHLNDLAMEKGAVEGEDERGVIVEPGKLRKEVLKAVSGGAFVVAGHLLPDIFRRSEVDFIAVLRCSPPILESRYKGRGYGGKKIRENVAAEILDVCLGDALKAFGGERVWEFDTSGKGPEDVAAEILSALQGRRKRRTLSRGWLQALRRDERLLSSSYF